MIERMQKLNAEHGAAPLQLIARWLDDHGLRLDRRGRHPEEGPLLSDLEDGVPGAAVLSHANGTAIAALEVMWAERMTHAAAVRAAPDAVTAGRLLLVGPHVSGRGAAILREVGIHHLDAAGNAWLRLPGVVVDVRGRTPEKPIGPRGSDATQSNLFSSRRAQVIFALISWPELVSAPIRRIAAASHVSVGLTQDTMKLLEREGYVRTWPEHHLDRVPELIDRWVAAFPLGLGSPGRTRGYHAERMDMQATASSSVRVSGEMAAPGLRGNTAVVYTDEDVRLLALRNRWRSDREPNVLVREMFWTEPETAEAPVPPGVRDAPPLLVFADLVASGDSRQRGVAEDMRKADRGLHASR
ncbi:hypothetical protein JOE38_002430 [Clavibacter michiganensis]|uniref:type IV toxin-antitoxin system AbiEi family antitoxin n=1 Tax=Clavibacter michiganensis TaxID=28447 RepID=UPI00195E9607|nr:type IV toxin-antitoxin system AbiEi family antitoxin [Clavibacter michiganensis]MBM7412607.1 hypothetical protein [Clavibacter michiganensis]